VVHADRRRGKPRSRLLYWFRTPPGVRVGRAALDEDAIRLIEEHNPDVAFDWTRILKGEPAPPEPRPRQDLQERRPPRAQRQRSTAPAVTAPAAEPERVPDLGPPDVQAPSTEPVQVALVPAFDVAPVPAFDEDGTPTDAMAEERGAEPAETPPTAAMARLGAEGLLRLRARHSEVLARISEKVTDPVRRDELKSQADRLNPDTWVTDSDVTAGLEQYETVFESLRSVVGRRRKRRRRRSSAAEGASPGSPEPSAESAEAEDDDAGDEL
jgi:hypothetical protein